MLKIYYTKLEIDSVWFHKVFGTIIDCIWGWIASYPTKIETNIQMDKVEFLLLEQEFNTVLHFTKKNLFDNGEGDEEIPVCVTSYNKKKYYYNNYDFFY